MPELPSCSVAIMAKAPIPGYCKTRLIPQLGADNAARLQQRLIQRTLKTAMAAEIGPVTLYCTPDCGHGVFKRARWSRGARLRRQFGANLGQRMLTAIRHELKQHRRVVILGTDCPALEAADIRNALYSLDHVEHVFKPAEDGGYVMLATRRYEPALFRHIHWGTAGVMRQTRHRLKLLGHRWEESAPSWDLDEWPDYLRAKELLRRHSP